jgi:uncharacterized protein
MSIEVKKLNKDKEINIQGGVVLDGFPSTGLVNAIASECLIRSVGTELVAVLDSPDFPPVSLINNHIPQFPARLYVNEGLKISFFISELNIHPALQKIVAKTILEWTIENKCRMIISAAGIPNISNDSNQSSDATNAGHVTTITDDEHSLSQVLAVSSTESGSKIIKDQGFQQLKSGTVAGIPGTLLNEGSLIGLDVIVFLVNTIRDAPDFRAAALVSTAVSKLIPSVYCDIGALMVEAQVVEDRMRMIRESQHKLSYIA